MSDAGKVKNGKVGNSNIEIVDTLMVIKICILSNGKRGLH